MYIIDRFLTHPHYIQHRFREQQSCIVRRQFVKIFLFNLFWLIKKSKTKMKKYLLHDKDKNLLAGARKFLSLTRSCTNHSVNFVTLRFRYMKNGKQTVRRKLSG